VPVRPEEFVARMGEPVLAYFSVLVRGRSAMIDGKHGAVSNGWVSNA